MKKMESNNSLIVRANQLIEAKYRLTATEQKIIYMLTAMIEKNDEDFRQYNLHIIDLIQLLDTDNKNKYAQVKEITRNMMKKVFTIHDIVKAEEIQVAWFSSINYKHKKGIVEFEFSPYLKPLMLQLKSSFTKFNINNVMQLRSGYSVRIYELLKQYEKIGKRQFDMQDFREKIGIQKNEYPLYADFKKRILLQCYKEINSKTDIIFEFEEIKEGRKVTTIKFIIHSKKDVIIIEPEPQKQLPPSTEDIPASQTNIEAIKAEFRQRYKGELVDRFIKQMLEEKGLEHVRECLQTFGDYIKGNKEITNIGGFFTLFVMKGLEKPVTYKSNDSITAPRHEVFASTPEEWKEMENFYANMGERKEKKILDETTDNKLQSMKDIIGKMKINPL